jgi:hypothetical protein
MKDSSVFLTTSICSQAISVALENQIFKVTESFEGSDKTQKALPFQASSLIVLLS